MEYRFSFNQRMLVWLGVAQLLLLALCFAIGLVLGQYRGQQATARPHALPAPVATSPAPQAQASGKIKGAGIALNEGE